MQHRKTKVTTKYQTTIPEDVRKFLGVESGKEVEWNIVKSMVIVDVARRIQNPVKFLTSQIRLNLDAVKLHLKSREDFR